MRVLAALTAVVSSAFLAAAGTASPSGRVSLGGVTLGASVLEVVRMYGAPGLVATTDDGLEWRWFDARGLDVDLLADNAMLVRQVLAGRPEPVRGVPSKLVQPTEFPVLEETAAASAAWMRSSGAAAQPEPENTISAWRSGADIVVLELRESKVTRVLALDAASAAHLGYISGPQRPRYRAPRLALQHAVDYPKRALAQRAEGVVVVEVELQASGAVKDVRVLVSSGNADIDAAETLSMRRSTFEPARCDGMPCEGVYLDREEYSLAL